MPAKVHSPRHDDTRPPRPLAGDAFDALDAAPAAARPASAAAPEGGCDVLAVVHSSSMEAGEVRLGKRDGPRLQWSVLGGLFAGLATLSKVNGAWAAGLVWGAIIAAASAASAGFSACLALSFTLWPCSCA